MFCICGVHACAVQGQTAITIIDRSPKGSPFEVSGEVLITESREGKDVQAHRVIDLRVRNTSEKPILLVLSMLTERGRISSAMDHIFKDDRFFTENVIKPGETVVIDDGRNPSGGLTTECCSSPIQGGRQASAEYTTIFVQYLDGSTFGDSAKAESICALRLSTVESLRELARTYADEGKAAFLKALNRENASDTNLLMSKLRAVQETSGTDAAAQRVRAAIEAAAQHEHALSCSAN